MAGTTSGTRTNQTSVPVLEEQSRALMQAVPDLVFLLGLDGTYIDIFSAASEDLFLPRDQLIGRTVLDVLPSPVGEDCISAISELKTPSDVSSFSYELQIDGNTRWFEGRVALCDAETVIVLVRDFTEQRLSERGLLEANRALNRRNQQLRRLEQELTRVQQRERQRMAHIVHDNLQQLIVGAKLNVATITSRISREEDRETTKMVVEALDEAIRQSQMLASDLCPPILYEGSLEQSLEWIRNHVARLYGLKVIVTIDADSPIELSESIRFTVFNAIQELLLNVVKHAGATEAFISVSRCEEDHIMVTVKDEGQGFSPLTGELGDNEAGGFGLFTLHERISWFGGNVEINSKPGEGCSVTLDLPVDCEDEHTMLPQSKDTSTDSLFSDSSGASFVYDTRGHGNIRVLLADDHAVLRDGLVRTLLQDPSISIVGEAPDGETAVTLASNVRPDVILMDVMMPGMGGAEATKLIKQANPEIHVIALSMYEEHEKGSEMKEAGASAFITKKNAASTIIDVIHTCYSDGRV